MRHAGWLRTLSMGMACAACSAGSAFAQVTPAAGYTPPDDTPSIRVGTTIFGNYTYQNEPKRTDVDGNSIEYSSFDIARAYINITGNISHIVAFRLTPDVVTRDQNVLSGNLVFRTKYAYLQTNLDDWMSRGSYARFGIQQTPYLDSLEGIYRYRFQGTLFAERTNYFKSSDGGVSFRYNFPSNYGDLHVGVYNGENYDRLEPNDQKAFMVRGTVRPFATGQVLMRGLRASVFYVGDHYVKDAPRTRLMGNVTFEHKYVNAAFEYLNATDQTRVAAAKVESHGYSIWATPKQGSRSVGWEALLRYDHLIPNSSAERKNQEQNRIIAGVAYWFPHPGGAPTTAILFDYDGQQFKNITASENKSWVVHLLINY